MPTPGAGLEGQGCRGFREGQVQVCERGWGGKKAVVHGRQWWWCVHVGATGTWVMWVQGCCC